MRCQAHYHVTDGVDEMTTLILYVFVSTAVYFMCSLLESVLLSTTHAHIALMIKKGYRSGAVLARLKRSINRPLAAILVFNTIAGTVGAMGVGAETYKLFGSEWIALSSGVLTITTLVVSELLPKTIGAAYWKKLAPVAAYAISGLIFAVYPLVLILEWVPRLVSRDAPSKHITREEIIVQAEMGLAEKVLSPMEARIIENLMLLNEIRTEDILTPRSVITAIQKDLTVAEAMESIPTPRFTRIPVYNNGLDDVMGLVLYDRLREAYQTGRRDVAVASLMGPIYAVPASKPIADLLDEFIARREHLFEVVDEYGGTAGIVTLEDALETLLGVEIVDEFDSVDDMRAFAVERWRQKRLERGL